jgi:hypothetical protein
MVYGLFRALPGDRAFLSPSPRGVSSTKLDASVGASGPHGFAVRLKRIRQSAIRVHCIPPRVRDDREPPLRWDETAVISEVIWVGRKQNYFFRRDWTSRIALNRFEKFGATRKRRFASARIESHALPDRRWQIPTARPTDPGALTGSVQTGPTARCQDLSQLETRFHTERAPLE